MANWMRRAARNSRRPALDELESRQLMAARISGVDLDGDTWVLELTGPGDMRVTQRDANGNTVPLGQPGLIDTIQVTGTGPRSSKLVGKVERGPNGDGKVFFGNLLQNRDNGLSQSDALGMVSIDMPDFWLGDTDPTGNLGTVPGSNTVIQGRILLENGVNTLRFGGVDTTAYFGSGSQKPLNQNGVSDQFQVIVRLPHQIGSSIIVDKVITDAQPATSSTTAPTYDSVVFFGQGRVNLFEANSIEGNKDIPISPYGFPVATGTGVPSIGDAQGTVFINQDAVTQGNFGASAGNTIGDIRVKGDATNFSAFVTNPTGRDPIEFTGDGSISGNERINNFFIGGETASVYLQAPGGAKNVKFGRGMDMVGINAHVIEKLEANRGAINSNVEVTRTIGQAWFGGDVINTNVLTGWVSNIPPVGSATAPHAEVGGGMTVLVAGDVTNSVFTASVDPGGEYDSEQPNDTGFGSPNDLVISGAQIDAKVEGAINNSEATPNAPDKAFYGSSVRLEHGPVVPPDVPQQPYSHPFRRPRSPGVPLVGQRSLSPQGRRQIRLPNNPSPQRPGANAAITGQFPQGPRGLQPRRG